MPAVLRAACVVCPGFPSFPTTSEAETHLDANRTHRVTVTMIWEDA